LTHSLNEIILTTMFRGILAAGLLGLAVTGESPLLAGEKVWSDNFDTGNTAGEKPAGWMVNETPGSGDQVRVVDKATVIPASPPYCVQLLDGSAPDKKANPFINHRFQPLAAGRITFRLQIPSTKQGPATVELLSRASSKSDLYFRLTFESSGKCSFASNAGDSSTTSVTWQAGRWQDVEIAWTADQKVSASVGGRSLVDNLTVTNTAPPSEFKIRAGGASISGSVAYADDIVIEEIGR